MSLPAVTLIKSELFRQGGLEKYSWQIAQDFCALGAQVTVLTSGTSHPPFTHPRLNLVSLPVKRSASFLNVLQFDRACADYLLRHPTPIIFGLDRNRFQTHIRAGNGAHAAYLQRRAQEEGLFKKMTFAVNPLHQAILSLEKKAFEHSDLRVLFTNSEMVKKEILSLYNIDPSKISAVHNGVEWQAMQSAFSEWEVAREKAISTFALDPKAFQFLFIGHNFRRKGLEKLLQALAVIKGENFQLSVVGKDKYLPYFERVVQRLGLSQKVFFHGLQNPILPFYQLADCLVIPSLYDPFANVTVEALAMGVFVISSKNNGGHEILSAENGTVIESLDDARAFALLLQQALRHPKTPQSALSIRQSIQHLDFSNQLRVITMRTLNC